MRTKFRVITQWPLPTPHHTPVPSRISLEWTPSLLCRVTPALSPLPSVPSSGAGRAPSYYFPLWQERVCSADILPGSTCCWAHEFILRGSLKSALRAVVILGDSLGVKWQEESVRAARRTVEVSEERSEREGGPKKSRKPELEGRRAAARAVTSRDLSVTHLWQQCPDDFGCPSRMSPLCAPRVAPPLRLHNHSLVLLGPRGQLTRALSPGCRQAGHKCPSRVTPGAMQPSPYAESCHLLKAGVTVPLSLGAAVKLEEVGY